MPPLGSEAPLNGGQYPLVKMRGSSSAAAVESVTKLATNSATVFKIDLFIVWPSDFAPILLASQETGFLHG